MKTPHRWMLYSIRTLFGSVLVFEILNWIGVLHFKLTFSWFGLIATALVVWVIVEFLWRELGELHAFEKGWLLFFIAASLLIDVFGDVLGWYGAFPWYDRVAHFAGGISVAIAVVIVLRATNVLPDVTAERRFSFWTQMLIAVSVVTLFGVLYEFEEYAETVFLHNNRLGDVFDTLDDIKLNMLGGIVGSAVTLRNVHHPIGRFLKKCVDYCVTVARRK